MAVSFCGFIPEKHSTSAPFRQVFRAYAKPARRKINGRQPPPVKIATIFLRGKIFAKQKDFREISSRLFCARTKSRELKFTEPSRVPLRPCSRGRTRAAPLPEKLAMRLFREPCYSFCHGFTVPPPSKREARELAVALLLKSTLQAKPRFCAAGLNLYPTGTYCPIRTTGCAGDKAS